MTNGSWTGVVAILIFPVSKVAFFGVVAIPIFPVSKVSFFGVVAILFSKLFAFYNFCLKVGTVEKREADLSMNLALTGAREKVVDYSVAYIGW